MTPRQKDFLSWLSLAALATIFGAGAAWGVTTARLATLEQKVDRIDRRVTAMYCGSLPADKQPGCQ